MPLHGGVLTRLRHEPGRAVLVALVATLPACGRWRRVDARRAYAVFACGAACVQFFVLCSPQQGRRQPMQLRAPSSQLPARHRRRLFAELQQKGQWPGRRYAVDPRREVHKEQTLAPLVAGKRLLISVRCGWLFLNANKRNLVRQSPPKLEGRAVCGCLTTALFPARF